MGEIWWGKAVLFTLSFTDSGMKTKFLGTIFYRDHLFLSILRHVQERIHQFELRLSHCKKINSKKLFILDVMSLSMSKIFLTISGIPQVWNLGSLIWILFFNVTNFINFNKLLEVFANVLKLLQLLPSKVLHLNIEKWWNFTHKMSSEKYYNMKSTKLLCKKYF